MSKQSHVFSCKIMFYFLEPQINPNPDLGHLTGGKGYKGSHWQQERGVRQGGDAQAVQARGHAQQDQDGVSTI